MNQLANRKELQSFYGIGTKTFWHWSNQESFPTFVEMRGQAPYWNRQEFDMWVRANCVQSATYGRWRLVNVVSGKAGSGDAT